MIEKERVRQTTEYSINPRWRCGEPSPGFKRLMTILLGNKEGAIKNMEIKKDGKEDGNGKLK